MTSDESRTFTGALVRKGKGAVIAIPFDPNEQWGTKSRHHTNGTVDGQDWRGELHRTADGYEMKLGPAWMRDCPTGERPKVVLQPEGPRRSTMGADVFEALDANPKALEFFQSLPSFYRNNFDRWITDAKRPETRAKRIAEMVKLLTQGKRER